MNWDTYGRFCTLRQSYTDSMQHDSPQTLSGSSTSTDAEKMEYSLSSDLRKESPLHPRRTLDQFYYGSLNDTSSRDADQVISKWANLKSGNDGRETAESESLMIMIDQLWCWVLDNSM